MRHVFAAFVGLLCLASAAVAASVKIPVGDAKIVVDVGLPLDVYTYKPANYRDGPLIVVFHGVQRNAEDYRNFAKVLGDRFGALIIAPHFDQKRFPNEAYQRGGIMKGNTPQSPEKWTYAAIPKIVGAVRQVEGRPDMPYYFIGHSAGGQFVTRMVAMAGGLGAKRVVAANPGSLVFPTREADFGYGFGGLPKAWSDDAAIQRYLAAPLTLYLGTADTDPNHSSLDRSAEALKQGPFRYARGKACFAAAQQLAKERGWKFNWRLVETPGVAHDSSLMFAAPEAKDALFGAQ